MKTLTPIRRAVEPLKEQAVLYAKEAAQTAIRHYTNDLINSNNDIDVAAPIARPDTPRWKRLPMQYRRAVFLEITKRRNPTRGMNSEEPNYADICKTGVNTYINRRMRETAEQYEAFIDKLEKKVGPHKSAILTGDHVWGCSILEIEFSDGRVEKWKTNQIDNISKFGKPFYQWPSRKVS